MLKLNLALFISTATMLFTCSGTGFTSRFPTLRAAPAGFPAASRQEWDRLPR
jgi:hypothetical protein